MPRVGNLIAWIERRDEDLFLAAFVGSGAQMRAPATQICASEHEARRWIEKEAVAVGLPVEWRAAEPPH